MELIFNLNDSLFPRTEGLERRNEPNNVGEAVRGPGARIQEAATRSGQLGIEPTVGSVPISLRCFAAHWQVLFSLSVHVFMWSTGL